MRLVITESFDEFDDEDRELADTKSYGYSWEKRFEGILDKRAGYLTDEELGDPTLIAYLLDPKNGPSYELNRETGLPEGFTRSVFTWFAHYTYKSWPDHVQDAVLKGALKSDHNLRIAWAHDFMRYLDFFAFQEHSWPEAQKFIKATLRK